MSRSIYRTSNDRHFNELLPPTALSSTMSRVNPRFKRNARDQRRSTGIRPNDVSLASTSTEDSTNEDEGEEQEEESPLTEFNDVYGTLTTSSPMTSNLIVNRIQSSFDNLTIVHSDLPIKPLLPDPIFHSDEIYLPRQTLDNNDSSAIETQHLEERIRTLETLLNDKDVHIEDLQDKLNRMTQNFLNAEEEISKLHQDKLTLIKALTNIQETKRSSNIFMRN